MIFLDSNVVIDVLERDLAWYDWSAERIASAARHDVVAASSIVVAECAGRFADLTEATAAFSALDIVIEDLPLQVAFAAGHLFRQHRRTTNDRKRILADFLIGAHAKQAGNALITRDAEIYSRYFPELKLITPETDNG